MGVIAFFFFFFFDEDMHDKVNRSVEELYTYIKENFDRDASPENYALNILAGRAYNFTLLTSIE